VGAVVDGVVTSVDTSCAMAVIRVGSGLLNVSVPPVNVGDRVRVQLLARDIILATEEPRGLSVRNQLRGVITSVADDEDDARLVSKLGPAWRSQLLSACLVHLTAVALVCASLRATLRAVLYTSSLGTQRATSPIRSASSPVSGSLVNR